MMAKTLKSVQNGAYFHPKNKKGERESNSMESITRGGIVPKRDAKTVSAIPGTEGTTRFDEDQRRIKRDSKGRRIWRRGGGGCFGGDFPRPRGVSNV